MMPSTSAATAQAVNEVVSPFPLPPEYAENYSEERLKAGLALPPPPVPTKFSVYNEEYDMEGPLMRSLSDLGIHQFYSSSASGKAELKKLNRSVVVAFLDLVDILINSPESPDRVQKIETIRLLFINMHHLINEYRPLQARDTLRQMILRQNEHIKKVTDDLEGSIATGNEILSRLQSIFSQPGNGSGDDSEGGGEMDGPGSSSAHDISREEATMDDA